MKKQRPGKLQDGLTKRLIPAFCLLLFLGAREAVILQPVWALEATLDAAVGYDDNATLSAKSVSSGFARYAAQIVAQWPRQKSRPEDDRENSQENNCEQAARLEFIAQGEYMDYFAIRDHYSADAKIYLLLPFSKGRMTAGLMAGGSFTRDLDVQEDDRNGGTAGGKLTWQVTPSWSLDFRQTWYWSDYIHSLNTNQRQVEAGPAPQRTQMMGNPQNQGNPQPRPGLPPIAPPPVIQESVTRDDTLSASEIQSTHYFPFFETGDARLDMIFSRHRLSSSLDIESYDSSQGSFILTWMPDAQWMIDAMLSFRQIEFESVPDIPDRDDTEKIVGVGAGRLFEKMEIFLRADYTDNDSSIYEESYNRLVTQCVISFFF